MKKAAERRASLATWHAAAAEPLWLGYSAVHSQSWPTRLTVSPPPPPPQQGCARAHGRSFRGFLLGHIHRIQLGAQCSQTSCAHGLCCALKVRRAGPRASDSRTLRLAHTPAGRDRAPGFLQPDGRPAPRLHVLPVDEERLLKLNAVEAGPREAREADASPARQIVNARPSQAADFRSHSFKYPPLSNSCPCATPFFPGSLRHNCESFSFVERRPPTPTQVAVKRVEDNTAAQPHNLAFRYAAAAAAALLDAGWGRV